MNRREFLETSLLSVLSGVTVTIVSACGRQSPTQPKASTSNNGSSGDSNQTEEKVSGVISANHGHSAVVTSAMSSGAGVTLNITGSSDHAHSVILTAAQVDAILAGNAISVLASNGGGHSHTVNFN